MANLDRTIIDPNADNLAALCAEPLWSAWLEPLARTDLQRQLTSQPEGRWSWAEEGLLLAWWTDVIGRKHVRVASEPSSPAPRNGEPTPLPPFLALVYPDVCYLCRQPGRPPTWQVLCGCGLFGSPAELGWMGECCAACHDQREEGLQPPVFRTVLAAHQQRVTSLAFLPDSQRLAAADLGGTWAIWDVHTGSKFHLDATRTRAHRLAGVGGRSTLAVLRGLAIDLVDPFASPPAVRTVVRLAGGMLLDLALSPDGRFLAVLTPERLQVHDTTRGGQEVVNVGTANLVEPPLGFSPDGRLLAAVMGRQLAVADVEQQRFREPIALPGEYVRAHAFAPDGATLALALTGHGHRLALWDLHQRKLTRSWELPGGGWEVGNRLVFHPNGHMLLATAGNRLIAWDTAGGAVLADLAPRQAELREIAVSPDGRTVAATTETGAIRLWPIELLGGRT